MTRAWVISLMWYCDWQVHKCLLASTSDFFRAMLCGSMKESKENSVELGAVRASSLQTIVDFIYSGEMLLDTDSLVETLDAANQLQVGLCIRQMSII